MKDALSDLVHESGTPFLGTRRLATVAAILVALATVGLLSLSGWFITAAAIAGGTGPAVAQAFNYLIPSALIRLLAIVRTVARYFERLLSHRASLSTLAAIRSRLFLKAAAAEAAASLRLSGGEAASILGAEIDNLEDRLIRAPAVAGALAAGLTAVALGALAGVVTACLIALCLAAGLWATRAVARAMLPDRAQAVGEALARLKADMAEYASAAGEIAVYGMTSRVTAHLEELAARHDASLMELARAEALVGTLLPIAAGAASAGAIFLSDGGPALAAMAALAAAAAGEAMGALARSEIKRPTSDALLRRVSALASADRSSSPADPGISPTVTIRDQAEEHVLAPGSRVAILGPSGSGKTRLLHTIAGLRNDAPQQVLVNGQDVRQAGLYRLGASFALVPQDPMLIAGTVADNLRLARPAVTDEQMWQALDVACLTEEIRALPQGLDQWIGDSGRMLSGGQRKRLALARGLLADRPWLLLDEPTEGLDAATEAKVVDSLQAHADAAGCGFILASHRAPPLAICDRSLWINNAKQ